MQSRTISSYLSVAYIVVIIIEGSLSATSMHSRDDIDIHYAGTNESLGTLGVTSSRPIYLPVIRRQTL